MAPTADELATRVANGAAWLGEHDPKGIFYFWHSAGIRPGAPLPALTDPIHHGYIEGSTASGRRSTRRWTSRASGRAGSDRRLAATSAS
jgi:hypothetical protein